MITLFTRTRPNRYRRPPLLSEQLRGILDAIAGAAILAATLFFLLGIAGLLSA